VETTRFRLRDVTVDLATGEIEAPAPDGGRRITRLAPQPAALLRMLVAYAGELVSIDDIRRTLWPDVQVEFDNSMHACVRQVRAALGDSAASPAFIETLPRRGYRLLATPEPSIDAPAAPRIERARLDRAPPARAGSRRRRAVAPTLALVALCGAATVLAVGMQRDAAPARRGVAVMSFDAPPWFPGRAGDVATALTARLGADPAWAVIGPSTTARFRDRPAPVADAAVELDVDYVVNARFAQREGRPQMLVEVVRSTDGVHVWVAWFDADAPADEVVARIAQQLATP
jgi:DNA-binding winged helix-turn-helix (wHTH) protein/TolB-like protein